MDIDLRCSPGDGVGIIACSDGVRPDSWHKVEELVQVPESYGLNVTLARTLTIGSCFSG